MFELICFSNFYLNTHFFIVSASSTLFLQFFPLSSSSPSFFTHPIVTFFHSFHFSVFSPSPIIFVVLNYALHGFIGFSPEIFQHSFCVSSFFSTQFQCPSLFIIISPMFPLFSTTRQYLFFYKFHYKFSISILLILFKCK